MAESGAPSLESMNKWDWIGASLVCVGFVMMILSVVLYSSLSMFLVLSGLAVLLAGVAVGTFLSDWNPLGWV